MIAKEEATITYDANHEMAGKELNFLGQPFPVKVIAKEEATITYDANHEMAGKELNFRIELVEVK